MTLAWCLQVLEKKGASLEFISRLRNLYSNNLSVVVVNNVAGSAVPNIRLTLRQGDIPSMELFCFGIDPLLCRLERVLQGIPIVAVPVQGPVLHRAPRLQPVQQLYKLIGYADDVKPAITTMEEFTIVDNSIAIFEKASGCKLHRDPLNKKCKFLPLGTWRTSLQQSDIPCDYMTLSDHLDMLGVTLMATWAKTKKTNGDAVQLSLQNTIRPWKAGKFLPVTQRGWSLNSFALPKIWFRTKSVDLRVCDIQNITSTYKSWLYQDMLIKPEEMILHRPHNQGGLGLHSVKYKAMAGFITSFLQTAANPAYCPSLLHSLLFRKYILEEEDVPGVPSQPPPYFSQEMFSIVKKVHEESSINIITMTEKDWSRLLTEEYITTEHNMENDTKEMRKCKSELDSPDTDWPISWSICRQPGVPPDLASFLWKVMLNILPTQARLLRLRISETADCKHCTEPGTLQHELIDCDFNMGWDICCSLACKNIFPTVLLGKC